MKDLENKLGYKFNNQQLLLTALTHVSYANEHNEESYERMEYLGDSVLQLVVSRFLFENYKDLSSGELSKYRSCLVSTKNLSSITKSLHFDRYIRLGKALNSPSDALMADIFESVLAGIYLDGGLNNASDFVYRLVLKNKQNVDEIVARDFDYKTALQEKLQAMSNRPKLEYKVVNCEQKDTINTFTMQLLIDDEVVAEVTDFSKKNCEKLLSKIALQKY